MFQSEGVGRVRINGRGHQENSLQRIGKYIVCLALKRIRSMEKLKLNTEIRTARGKNTSRKARAAGKIPATLYGQKEEPLSLSIDEASIRTILHVRPESAIVDLSVDGKTDKGGNVIIRDIQRHPASGKVLHVDLQRISLDEKIRLDVLITLLGDPKGVKEQGGILERGTRHLSIMCLASAIPETINIDIAELGIGDSIRIKTLLEDYADIDFLDDPETAIATVIPPMVEEVKVEVEGEEEVEEGAEPDVIPKEAEAKKEEEGEDSKS
jgi:large subunit ribosomal protein L25